MLKRDEIARDIYMKLLPNVQAPSVDELEDHIKITAKISILAADLLIKELENENSHEL